MISIFSVLRQRKKHLNLNEIDMTFPPKYMEFLETFEEEKPSLIMPSFLSPSVKRLIPFGEFEFEVDNEDTYSLVGFFSPFESVEIYNRIYKEDEDFDNLGMIPIGSCSMNTMILVGTKGDYIDKIFLDGYFSSTDDRVIEISSNIFNFLSSLSYSSGEEIFIRPYRFSQLYKNWGEDFWRVREES